MRISFPAAMVLCAGTLVVASSSASAAASTAPTPYTYVRHYVKGQVSHDSYTELEGGAEVTAVARLRSYIRDGIGGEQVKWVELTADGQEMNAQARAFPPYDLSLDPADPDGLAQPNTQTAGELEGPVDDLLTVYVGLSDGAGIDKVHLPGQSYVVPTPLPGNFSTSTAPVGEDLVQLTTTLTSLTDQQATFTSSYQPPSGGGLQLTAPFMSSPVCGSTPNNFELVEDEGSEYLALWGCESFTVTTVVDRDSGQIVSAQMNNPLQLDGALCQDEALTECTSIPATTQTRTVQITRS